MKKLFRYLPYGLLSCISVYSAPLRIGYLFPAIEYSSEASLRWIANQMETRYASRSFFFQGQDIDQGSSAATPTVITNINDLDSLDVMVVYVRRVWLTASQQTRFQQFFNSGKGMVGIRSAAYAIQSWDLGRGIDSVVWGGAYNMHTDSMSYTLRMTAAASTHPIFQGVGAWTGLASLYRQNYNGRTVASDANILMNGNTATEQYPVTWTRVRNGGNVFFTSTGTQGEFQDPNFQKMIINAVLWAGKALPATPVMGKRHSGRKIRIKTVGVFPSSGEEIGELPNANGRSLDY